MLACLTWILPLGYADHLRSRPLAHWPLAHHGPGAGAVCHGGPVVAGPGGVAAWRPYKRRTVRGWASYRRSRRPWRARIPLAAWRAGGRKPRWTSCHRPSDLK